MLYRVLYPFQGDPFSNQLSFEAGTVLVVPDHGKANNADGWAYGHYANDSTNRGWFPLTYVEQIADPQKASMPVSQANPPFNNNNPIDTQDDGFGGAPMGVGGAPFGSSTTITPVASQAHQQQGDPASNQARIRQFHGVLADTEDDGFGGAPMGGDSTSSSTMVGGAPFGSFTNTPVAPQGPQGHQQYDIPIPTNPQARSRPLHGVGKAISSAASKTGNALSNAASRTGTAISNATSKTASATRNTTKEAGHRYRDMEQQRQEQMDQKAVTHTTERSKSGTQMTTHQKTIAPGGGILPSKCTDTTTMVEKTGWGTSKTTTTSTTRPSGGFFPGIRGKTTTTQTVTRGPMG